MDSLVNRVRAFVEGIVVMEWPVYLAMFLKKVDVKKEKDKFIRAISIIAAFTLFSGLLPFLMLNVEALIRLPDMICRLSKVLVQCSAILQMVLANLILLLISNSVTAMWASPLLPLIFIGIIVCRCKRLICRNDQAHDEVGCTNCHDKLEQSLDFSATVTMMLFLTLEGVAMEGPVTSVGQQDLKPCRIAFPVYSGFLFCVAAAFIMALGVIPPMIIRNDDDSQRCKVCLIFDAICVVLALFITIIVLAIMPTSTVVALSAVAIPWCAIFILHVFFIIVRMLTQPVISVSQTTSSQASNPAASLELTKVTFMGFLAVSINSLASPSSSCHVQRSSPTYVFVFLTGSAVIWGLLWRLLTHNPWDCNPSGAAKFARFTAHVFVTAAVIPFALMAHNALLV